MEFIVEFSLFFIELMFWVWIAELVILAIIGSKKSRQQEREELIQEVIKIIHTVEEEKHGDLSYWFDADTGAFLGQGCTEDEIRVHLLERFKGHIFLLDEKRAMAGPELKIVSIDQLATLHKVSL
jgi:hypothetical protein